MEPLDSLFTLIFIITNFFQFQINLRLQQMLTRKTKTLIR